MTVGKFILLVIGICFAGLFIYLEAISDVPEKHSLRSIDARIFKIIDDDTTVDYDLLTNNISLDDTNSTLLLGIRFELDYVSMEYENFWDYRKYPYGWFGNVDTLKEFQVFLGSSGRSISEQLKGDRNFTEFHCNEMFITNHSGYAGKGRGLRAEYIAGPDSLIVYYNTEKGGFNVVSKTNYIFWRIPADLNKEIIQEGVRVTAINDHGDTIPLRPHKDNR